MREGHLDLVRGLFHLGEEAGRRGYAEVSLRIRREMQKMRNAPLRILYSLCVSSASNFPNTRLDNYTDRYIFVPMNKAQRTRRHIIEKTAPLFNMNGFDGTSLTDLCRVTGLTKGALYGNFADKEELATEAFRYTVSKMRSMGSRSMLAQQSYRERLDGLLGFFLQAVLNSPVRGGCPLLNTAVEADDNRPSMRKVVVEELEKSVNSMTKLLDKGKAAGEFKQDFNSREIAMLCFCAIEGAIMYSRVSASDEAMQIVIRNLRSIIKNITV